MTVLARGEFAQSVGKPTTPAQSPSVITLNPNTQINTNSEVDLLSVGGTDISLGQATESASIPVVIASNQSAIPVTGSLTNPSNLYKHINTNATTTVKASPGTLVAININTKGATSNIATVTDGATTIAVIDTTSQIASLQFNLTFTTSLTVTTSAGTAADLTVVFQ